MFIYKLLIAHILNSYVYWINSYFPFYTSQWIATKYKFQKLHKVSIKPNHVKWKKNTECSVEIISFSRFLRIYHHYRKQYRWHLKILPSYAEENSFILFFNPNKQWISKLIIFLQSHDPRIPRSMRRICWWDPACSGYLLSFLNLTIEPWDGSLWHIHTCTNQAWIIPISSPIHAILPTLRSSSLESSQTVIVRNIE